MPRDVFLVTIDCWRWDALKAMPRLRSRTESWQQRPAICAGHATNWAFPAILNGTYYPRAYTESGELKSGTRPLPQVLGEKGYRRRGVVGSNVYLAKWEPYFDAYWNDGMEGEDAAMYGSDVEKWATRAFLTLAMRKRAPIEEVIDRVRAGRPVPARSLQGNNGKGEHENGDESKSGSGSEGKPRFDWIHLMDLHMPFYPGIGRAAGVGLVESYRAVVEFYRRGNDASERTLRTIQRLYWACVKRLDERIDLLFETIPKDAVVIVLGDHGEDFGHGVYGHLQPYDECLKVPLLARNLPDLPETVRQIDVPAHLLDALGVPIPEQWDSDLDREEFVAPFLSPGARNEELFAGVRTRDRKLIRTYDAETLRHTTTEMYDLDQDPNEQRDLSEREQASDLEEYLDAFIEREEIGKVIDPRENASEAARERLEELGYM